MFEYGLVRRTLAGTVDACVALDGYWYPNSVVPVRKTCWFVVSATSV